jgi:hypothetical protein
MFSAFYFVSVFKGFLVGAYGTRCNCSFVYNLFFFFFGEMKKGVSRQKVGVSQVTNCLSTCI